MSSTVFLRARFLGALLVLLLSLHAATARAASIRGMVTDASGAKVTGATVVLVSDGKVAASTVSTSDGSFQILTGLAGRFYLAVSAKGFRQLETPGFYAGRMDSVERNLVLEPEWVRESIVVTATGTPTPQPQTSAATSVLGPLDLALQSDMVDALRTMPGAVVVETGQRGAQTSLWVRGGNSDANKVLLDGVSVDDLGGQFDFGSFSTTGIERAEVYRGTNSSLYGADAGSGVVSLTTPHGTTSFPSLMFDGDAGNLNTSREELALAGAHRKLDYFAAFNWFQTANDLPMDEYHVATTSANLGWQPNANTQIRGTLHYGVDATGVPNAWDFYHIADNATQKDQDLYVSASIDNQTTPDFHNAVRYGLARKREQYNQWTQEGIPDIDGNGWGRQVTITGANGYSATGAAVLDFAGIYPYNSQYANNRDQLLYQGDYRVTPHLTALIGFHFENERGAQNFPGYSEFDTANRTNYDYLAAVQGDFKSRLFYTLGGSLEHYSEFGTTTSPRAGLSFYAIKPRSGAFSGTRILFNFGDGVREPKLTEELSSLYHFLDEAGLQASAEQLGVGRIAAPTTRTYEGGFEQTFLTERILLRASYFHNQFGKEIESVPGGLIPSLIPGLSAAQIQTLIDDLGVYYSQNYTLAMNSQAFRAQGVETTLEGGIGRNIFLRGGYTYLDSVVQRSFTSDNQAWMSGLAPTVNGIPIGAASPLRGARPFRRPPHTGFATASYSRSKFTGMITGAFSSRSDDATYLYDAYFNPTMLLPNRNLDFGYAKIDLGASYKLRTWLGIYAQAENLTNNQHIAPIGYPSLPATVRTGLRLDLGRNMAR